MNRVARSLGEKTRWERTHHSPEGRTGQGRAAARAAAGCKQRRRNSSGRWTDCNRTWSQIGERTPTLRRSQLWGIGRFYINTRELSTFPLLPAENGCAMRAAGAGIACVRLCRKTEDSGQAVRAAALRAPSRSSLRGVRHRRAQLHPWQRLGCGPAGVLGSPPRPLPGGKAEVSWLAMRRRRAAKGRHVWGDIVSSHRSKYMCAQAHSSPSHGRGGPEPRSPASPSSVTRRGISRVVFTKGR